MNKEDVFYRALLARDHRFDGKFWVGVKTTGIYCRPICPARPKRKNVEFFASYPAAERAGYRPCLRCRPEAAPSSAAWLGKSAVVQRALRMIHHLAVSEGEEHFAARFGVSARHLRRLFVEEIGKTPKQLMYESRLNISRQLIVETGLSMADVAAAADFQSVRRFNDAFRGRFKKSPSQIRRQAGKSLSSLCVSLAYRPPYDFAGLLEFYRTHSIANLERFDMQTMFRVVQFGESIGTVAISDVPEKSCLRVEINFPDVSRIHTIISRVRQLFDLDSDPVLIANALESDPKIRSLLRRHPGIRLPSGWDAFEVAVTVILGQLVSLTQARRLVSELVELAGTESGLHDESGKSIRLFPTPEQLCKTDLSKLKTTKIRKQTLTDFAEAVHTGKVSLSPAQDVEEFMHSVRKIKGIGAWSASFMALKVLRHTDAFPETDLILARALDLHSVDVIDRMRPWRGYVAALFWREYHAKLSYAGKAKEKK